MGSHARQHCDGTVLNACGTVQTVGDFGPSFIVWCTKDEGAQGYQLLYRGACDRLSQVARA